MHEPKTDQPKTDEPEITPPSAVRVVQRAQVLAAIACRGFLEQESALPASGEMFEKLLPWLSATGAADELEPQERTQLSTPIGALPGGAGLAWQIESTAMLAWALGLLEPPPLYVQLEAGPVARAVCFLEPEIRVLNSPTLRPASDIQHMANLYLTCHWRLRDFRIRPRRMDFQTFAEGCKWADMTLDGLDLCDRELALFGNPIDSYNPDNLIGETGVIEERHHALNWLLGHELKYSDVDTST